MGSTDAESNKLQKYGVPLYGAGWVPYDRVIRSKLNPPPQQKDEAEKEKEEGGSKDEAVTDKSDEIHNNYYVVLTGGGGEGNSGIRNAVLLSRFDLASNSLSDQPVAELRTGSDLPYRMAVHPHGDGIVCAFQNNCRLFEWDEVANTEIHKLGVKISEKVLSQLKDVGQQLALTFDSQGSKFAAGSEDGNLRVWKWPSLEIILNESQAHASVKDLSFSPDGKFLVSLGNRGPVRVWDLTSSAIVTSLAKENDEVFASCRFSPAHDQDYVLYIAAITDKGASILKWNTTTWKRIQTQQVIRDSVSSFNISADGKHLAIGTASGDISIINSSNLLVRTTVKKAHLGIVTALAFSYDSRVLVSASMDSSVRVTVMEDKRKSGGLSLWIIVFVLLLAIAAYVLKDKGIIP